MRKTRSGFTLVELIIVMSIIGVLAGSTVLISISTNLQRGRDTKRKADLAAIQSALEIYRSDVRAYPGNKDMLSPDYMGTVPKDPQDPSRTYSYSQAGTTYQLCADLETVAGVNDYCVTNP